MKLIGIDEKKGTNRNLIYTPNSLAARQAIAASNLAYKSKTTKRSNVEV